MEQKNRSNLGYNGYNSRRNSYGNYNQTANAYKYEQSPVWREKEEQPEGYRVIKRRKTVTRRKKIRIIDQIEKSLRMPKQIYILAAVAFLGAFSVLWSFSAMHVKKIAVQKLESEVKVLKESNRAGQLALTAGYDIEEIKIAAEKIGMSPPKPHQIKYIDVPKESYAKATGQAEAKETDNSALNIIADFLRVNE
ncbi:MAG: hypothetical protein LBS21_12765 [Clostridiales bacterium]|jgi:cell division protein FtsL|nr:hypothetical protein [Clostridiales bacterium]